MQKIILGTAATLCLMAIALLTLAPHGLQNTGSTATFTPTGTTSAVISSTTPTTTTTSKAKSSGPSKGSEQETSTAAIPSNEKRLTAYLTGYAWPDNTPPSLVISNPVIHQEAGGTGTYGDPITVAVGHSLIDGKDILDYKAGTLFYVPNLHKYFIVEDTCGDGDTPQDGPCHNLDEPGHEAPAGAQTWLDLWVGGVGSKEADVLACEDAITDLHMVIVNPAKNYAVNPGPVYGASCAQQFGDTVAIQ